MTSLHKKNKYSNYSISIGDSKTEYTNYVPIINNSKLNPLKNFTSHKKIRSIELDFYHLNLIKNKYETNRDKKSYSLTEKNKNLDKHYSYLPLFSPRNSNSNSNKENYYSPLNVKNNISFHRQRAFSFNSIDKINLKKKKIDINKFKSLFPEKSRNNYRNDNNCISNYNSYNNNKNYNRSLINFINSSRKMRFDKLKLHLKKIKIEKCKELNINKLDFLKLQEYNFNSIINTINIFEDDNIKYYKFLINKIELEKEERDLLIEKKNQLRTDIFYLKHRLGKIKNFVEQCLDNKLFLLCVKNHTNQFANFSINDQELYEKDQKLLDSLDSVIKPKKIDKLINKKKHSQGVLITGLDNEYYEEEENFLNNLTKQKPIFESIELFKKHLDIISTDIKNYLIEYNELQDEINLLREELLIKKKELIIQDENNKKFISAITILKSKIHEKEIENKDLFNIKENMIKYDSIQLSPKVDEKILLIYNSIKSKINLIPVHKDSDTIDTIKRLKDIEFVFIKLLSLIQKFKKENIQEYLIVKKIIDERIKIRNNEIQKESVQKQFEEKVKKVLLKNKKLIYKPLRKVAEIYKFK